MFMKAINSTCHLQLLPAQYSPPSGHYFPCHRPNHQIILACLLKHTVRGRCAALTACLSIYLFIGNLLKLLLPQLFMTLNSLVTFYFCLFPSCPLIAAHPGLVYGQSVLSGVDRCVQASEVWLQLPRPQPEPSLHRPQSRGDPPADAAQPGLRWTRHHSKYKKQKLHKKNYDTNLILEGFHRRKYTLWH